MLKFVIVIALLAIAAPVQAADGAQSRAIGFSGDGKYFAFEQYGIQDGSGLAYSDIFVLDIASDSWVKGSPIRVMEPDGDRVGMIDQVRAEAWTKAKPILDAVKATGSVDTLAHMPFTEIASADRRKVRFARYYDSMANPANYDFTGSWELAVKDVTLPAPADCTDTNFGPIVGMEVVLKDVKSGASLSVAKDASIPKPRDCPLAYDIEGIFAPTSSEVPGYPMVALIGVYSRGFEGSDRRIIAVPIRQMP